MTKTLADVGEFGLIERIERAARRVAGRAVALGIGDDAAVLRPPRGEHLVVTTDALVEGVHFRWETHAPAAVGRRALVASLSDLAAMGARPLGCVLALAAPPSLPLARADGVARGLLAAAREFACPLVGGNVARARQTSLTLTALGSVRPGRILTRRGARVGDRILVTGTLGGAALGVARGGPVRRVPEPRLAAGAALARVPGIGGCIDVSDGLEADLGHLLAAAEGGPLGAEIEAAKVPVPRGFHLACGRVGLDPERLVLAGGEDYELLFSARPESPAAPALARRLGVPVAEIGRVTRRRRGRSRRRAGGWRHF
jgi:thiamine-monophosphate kinase